MRVRLLLIFALFSVWAWGRAAVVHAQSGSTYYLAPDGDDAHDGSLAHPWATMSHALTQLAAGDTLRLRQGTYREHGLTLSLQGTEAAPITIESYPGEWAVVDGGIDDFLAAPNARWELVNASINLYRSIDTFSGSTLGLWLQDESLHLITYDTAANLESTNYGPVNGYDPIYQGPSGQLRADGHLYIRLSQNPNDLIDPDGNPIAPIPADVNPNHNAISVFFSKVLFYLDGATFVNFRHLDFAHAEYLFDVRNASQHLDFEDCNFYADSYGLVVRSASDFTFRGCEFDSGMPDYVYWTDIKNVAHEVAEAYPELQSKAISGDLSGFDIRDCVFRGSMDGVGVMDGSSGVHIINNHFIDMRDDALDLRAGISEVEIAHNMLWGVGSGISMTGTEVQPLGPVYIHHNVIDASIYQHGGREGNYRGDDWPTWTVIDPFGSHGDDMAAGWKVYNNTIVTRKNGYETTPAGPHAVTGNPQKYLYNNIFLVLDDRTIFRGDAATSGAHYDGDVFHRLVSGPRKMFRDFGDGRDYNSLADFRAGSGTSWELHGLEVDPQLDLNAIQHNAYDADTIWQRYVPANLQMDTRGAAYDGLAWPEMNHNFYRGALAPLYLWAAPDASALHLTWELTATLPVSATWRIRYDGPAGDQSSPVSGLAQTTRGYTLAGLTPGTPYTLTLEALVGSSAVITDVLTATPAAAPAHLPALTLTPAGANLHLSWTHDETILRYQIWRSTTPDFGLDAAPASVIRTAPWQFDDAGAVGDAAENHFYRVVGLGAAGVATTSGLIGEFDFALTPGE